MQNKVADVSVEEVDWQPVFDMTHEQRGSQQHSSPTTGQMAKKTRRALNKYARQLAAIVSYTSLILSLRTRTTPFAFNSSIHLHKLRPFGKHSGTGDTCLTKSVA